MTERACVLIHRSDEDASPGLCRTSGSQIAGNPFRLRAPGHPWKVANGPLCKVWEGVLVQPELMTDGHPATLEP